MRPTKTTISVTRRRKTCKQHNQHLQSRKVFLSEHDRRVNKGRHLCAFQQVVTGEDWEEVTKL